MRNLRKAAVVAAALASVSFLGAGTASAQPAHDGYCKSHDLNVALLNDIGIANGIAGNLINGEGDPGGQDTHVGSIMGCGGGHGH
ncbi:hypothetical protein [Streptomyces sp. NPDC048248]|uniref:hypothetical protein n=1 Tax=Streptomyces sp. NPDC048248 TaxID=3365523 RepID=UPI00371460D7